MDLKQFVKKVICAKMDKLEEGFYGVAFSTQSFYDIMTNDFEIVSGYTEVTNSIPSLDVVKIVQFGIEKILDDIWDRLLFSDLDKCNLNFNFKITESFIDSFCRELDAV